MLYLGHFFQGSIPLSLVSGIQALDVSQNNLPGENQIFFYKVFMIYTILISLSTAFLKVKCQGLGSLKMWIQFQLLEITSFVEGIRKCICQLVLLNPQTRIMGLIHYCWLFKFLLHFYCCLCFFCLLVARCWVQKSWRKPQDSTLITEQTMRLSCAKLVRATDGFSTHNLTGTGNDFRIQASISEAMISRQWFSNSWPMKVWMIGFITKEISKGSRRN